MIDLHQHIGDIIALPSITVLDVARALGAALQKERESPAWEFYEAGSAGPFERVYFNLSRATSRWLLAWNYVQTQAPLESQIDLSRYGTVKDVDVNPRIPPEGTLTYRYDYMGLKLFVEFTNTTRRLRGAALHRD